MSMRGIKLRGFKLDKSGQRVERDPARLSVSARLKQKGKQKISYGRRGK